jgi:hypothetical protein
MWSLAHNQKIELITDIEDREFLPDVAQLADGPGAVQSDF